MKWKDKLISDIGNEIKSDTFWNKYFARELSHSSTNIHLAIFNEPFLQLMYKKQKTIESRFSINNVVPYNRILEGDIVVVKRSGGNVEALFIATDIKYYSNLNPIKLHKLENDLGSKIGWHIDPEFLTIKKDARYLTLMQISHLTRINPIISEKKDKTGWSVIKLGYKNTLFEL